MLIASLDGGVQLLWVRQPGRGFSGNRSLFMSASARFSDGRSAIAGPAVQPVGRQACTAGLLRRSADSSVVIDRAGSGGIVEKIHVAVSAVLQQRPLHRRALSGGTAPGTPTLRLRPKSVASSVDVQSGRCRAASGRQSSRRRLWRQARRRWRDAESRTGTGWRDRR